MMIDRDALVDLKLGFGNTILLNERNILDYLYGVLQISLKLKY